MDENTLDDLKWTVAAIVAYSPYRALKPDLDAICEKVRDAKDLRPAVLKALKELYPDVKVA